MHLETISHAGDSTNELLAEQFTGSPDGVRDALDAMRNGLNTINASDEETFSAELVIAEALNNVVEHALADIQAPTFFLSMKKVSDGVRVDIRDQGHPMPDGRPPIGDLPEITENTNNLPEGGFGWFLIRELARDLSYARVEDENQLSFRLSICTGA